MLKKCPKLICFSFHNRNGEGVGFENCNSSTLINDNIFDDIMLFF